MKLLIPQSKEYFILTQDAKISGNGYRSDNNTKLNELREYIKSVKKENTPQNLVFSGFEELSESDYQRMKDAQNQKEDTSIILPKDTVLRFVTMFTSNSNYCTIDIIASSIFSKQIKSVKISIDDLNTFSVEKFDYQLIQKGPKKKSSWFEFEWRYSEKDIKAIPTKDYKNKNLISGSFTKEQIIDHKNFILTFDVGSVKFGDVYRKNCPEDWKKFVDLKRNSYRYEIADIKLVCRCESFTKPHENLGQIEYLAALKTTDIKYEVWCYPIENNQVNFNTQMIIVKQVTSRDSVREALKKHYQLIDDLCK